MFACLLLGQEAALTAEAMTLIRSYDSWAVLGSSHHTQDGSQLCWGTKKSYCSALSKKH